MHGLVTLEVLQAGEGDLAVAAAMLCGVARVVGLFAGLRGRHRFARIRSFRPARWGLWGGESDSKGRRKNGSQRSLAVTTEEAMRSR